MKIGQLYDLNSFQAFMDSGEKPGFQDAEAGVVLARNLTQVDPRIFEKKYPELTFLNSGVQIDNTGGYARRIQSLRLVEEGGFKDVNDRSDNKGKISLEGEDSFLPVYVKEATSHWSDDEIEEANLQGVNLVQRFLQAHNKKYNQTVDSIGFIGQNDSDGLLNYSGFSSTSATNAIALATAQELYDDISGLIRAQWDAVFNTAEYKANVVTMPTDVYNKIAATILNTTAGSASVLKALQDNYPGVSFMATAKADSVDGSSVTCAFSTSDEVMKMRIPVPLKVSEIYRNGFAYSVDSKFRIGGLDILEDAGGYLLTGL